MKKAPLNPIHCSAKHLPQSLSSPSVYSGGYIANSLAVMNEAIHQVFDLNSLLMSLLAAWIAKWKPNEKKTFGYHRAGKGDIYTERRPWERFTRSFHIGVATQPHTFVVSNHHVLFM